LLSCLHGRKFSRALLHISFPHRLELRQQLEIGFSVFVDVLLDSQSPFIKAPHLQVEDVVAHFKKLDGLLVSVKHHQTASNVVLEYGVIYGLNV
jgi:hypothetical protein